MARREHCYDNPVAVCFCCGGLPLLGLVKGLLALPFILVVLLFSSLGISLALTPRTAYYAYVTIVKTARIGPNLKFLLCISVWILLSLWPLVAVVGALFVAFGLAIGYSIYLVFDAEVHLLGGWIRLAKETIDCVQTFWMVNYDKVHTESLRLSEPYDDDVFDIPIYKLPIGLVLSVGGTLYLGLWGTALGILKLIPAIFRGWYLYTSLYLELFKEDGCCAITLLIPFIVGFALWPVAVVLCDALLIVCCFFYGACTGVQAVRKGLPGACRWLYNQGRKLDLKTNRYIFDAEHSCCREWNESPSPEPAPAEAEA